MVACEAIFNSTHARSIPAHSTARSAQPMCMHVHAPAGLAWWQLAALQRQPRQAAALPQPVRSLQQQLWQQLRYPWVAREVQVDGAQKVGVATGAAARWSGALPGNQRRQRRRLVWRCIWRQPQHRAAWMVGIAEGGPTFEFVGGTSGAAAQAQRCRLPPACPQSTHHDRG